MKRVRNIVNFINKGEFYLHIAQKIDEEKIIDAEPVYKLWLCDFGVGNAPFLILTNHIKELFLGDSKACLRWLDVGELVNYFEDKGYPSEKTILKLCQIFSVKPIKKCPHNPTCQNCPDPELKIRETMLSIFNTNRIYKTTLPINDGYLQQLLEKPEKLKKEIELFLSEGCIKDSKLLFWGKTRLPIVSDDLKDYWIEKYRGHCLVIKNPKCGFSTLAQKLGRNIGYSSSASIRGYADSQGNIRHGIYHANFGSVALDEASRYKEIVSDVAMTFMELGKQEVVTAGINITNLGSPTITIIVNVGRQVATPIQMLEAIDKILPSLTTTPEAFGSRFGMILFSNILKPVIQKKVLSPDEILENSIIVESIFEAAIPKIKSIYRDERILNWLNIPIEHYKDTVLKLVAKLPEQIMFGERIRIFWLEHVNAFRHIRGVALDAAIVDNIAEILKADFVNEELVDEILESAEVNLKTVISINLDSLKEMVNVTEETEPELKKLFIDKFEGLKGYKKAIVFCYVRGLAEKKFSIKKFTLLNELSSVYDGIEKDKVKEIFGKRYGRGFSRVIQAFDKLTPEAKLSFTRDLETLFGIELSYSENQQVWVLKASKSDVEFLFDYMKELI